MNRITSNKRPLKRNDQFDFELVTADNPQSEDDSKSKRIRYMVGQPLPEQGWQRCQAGFDGVSTEEEERRRLHQLKRGAKRLSLGSRKPAQEGSSLEIDWSSSSEDLPDVEPLPQEPPSRQTPKRASHKKRTIRKSRCKTRLHQGTKLQSGRLEVPAGEEDDVDITEDLQEEGTKRGESRGEGSKLNSMTMQGQSTVEEKKSSQIHISDYDSPSEDQFTLTSNSQQGSSSLHISDHSPTPQPTPDHSPSKESPQTGTELLKRLKLPEKTPDKEGATGGPSGGGDSAKKKKKFVRGGLAEDLQRVMNREKSSMAFWSHRTAETATTTQSLAIDLLVLSLEEVRGLFVTRCQMQPVTSETNEEMFVLFSQANGRQLKLGLGSRVRVHPPWQKLILPNYKQSVILCTYFCQSVDDGTEGGVQTGNQSSSFPNMMSGPSLGEQLRPLQLFQPRSNPAQTTTLSTLQSVLPQSTEAPKGHVSDSFLDSIAQTGMYSAAGMCVQAIVHRVYCRRCHTEATLASRKFPSYSHATQSTQSTLLIQDDQGVFCELQVTLGGTGEEEEEEWRRCLRHGEGKTFIFSGLKVMKRVNRTRSPGLFSLIDSLWSPCERTTSQTDTEPQDFKSQGLVSPQSFCYILGVQTLKNSIREDGTHRARTPYREPVIHTLGEIEKMSDICSQRVACYAKLVYAHPVINPHSASQQPQSQTVMTDWHLFLTDHSLTPITELPTKTEKKSGNMTGMVGDESCSEGRGTRLVYVHVRRSCSAVECAKDRLGVPGSLVLLRDLCCEQVCLFTTGHLCADTYTTIDNLTENEKETERKCSPQDGTIISRLSSIPIPPLPDLGLHSDQYTLVSISGVVTGVDETTAYSWPACDTCSNDQLEVDPNSGSELHCKVCQRSVTSPLTRMHLEITLDTPALGHGEAKVKVQLLQSSIKQVLPPLSSQEDGYDMQCIMGINIGPISCFLRAVSKQPGEPVNFDLEEVSLEPCM